MFETLNDKFEKRLMIDMHHCQNESKETKRTINYRAEVRKDVLTPGMYSFDVSIIELRGRVKELLEHVVYFKIDETDS